MSAQHLEKGFFAKNRFLVLALTVLLLICNGLLYEFYLKTKIPPFRANIWATMFLGTAFWSAASGALLAIIPRKNQAYGSRWKHITLIMAGILSGFYFIVLTILAIRHVILN